MSINKLNSIFINSVEHGHSGLFSLDDICFFLNKEKSNYRGQVSRFVSSGLLTRVCKGIYTSPLIKLKGDAIYNLVKLLRPFSFNYISLETQLSHLGVISQQTFNYFTVMTNGRSGTFKTSIGTIEFTHTSKKLNIVSNDIYYDSDVGIYRANEALAIAELHNVGRNLELIINE